MTDTPFTIPHRYRPEPVYTTTTASTLRDAVIEAVSKGAGLHGASLIGACLRGAYLIGADLRDADLSSADLSGACLSGANLIGACLSGAGLHGASLIGACLRGADLRGASLSGTDLRGAWLSGAYLRDGIKLHASSHMAYAGPVGDGRRMVAGFLAQPDDAHREPWLVLQCGCFTGNEAAYLERVDERYPANPTEPRDARLPEWRAQCLGALAGIKAIVATWPIVTEPATESATTEKQEAAS